mgnify:CR=1 FL=1
MPVQNWAVGTLVGGGILWLVAWGYALATGRGEVGGQAVPHHADGVPAALRGDLSGPEPAQVSRGSLRARGCPRS